MSYIRFAVVHPVSGDIVNTGMCCRADFTSQASSFPGHTVIELPMDGGGHIRSWAHRVDLAKVGEPGIDVPIDRMAVSAVQGSGQPTITGVIVAKF